MRVEIAVLGLAGALASATAHTDRQSGAPRAASTTHTYFIAAEEVTWDYAPRGRALTGAATRSIDDADGVRRTRYLKAIYREYKQGYIFVFDRVTGRPVWPIEERPVPQSTLPGERTAPTQPFPTRPPPFERFGVSEDDVIDFTPELKAEALAILRTYDFGPPYTPPTERGTLVKPGYSGGANCARQVHRVRRL